MDTSPQGYVETLTAMARARDWKGYAELRRRVLQQFADRLDWDGLESFFEEATKFSVSPDLRLAVTSKVQHLAEIGAALETALERALVMTKADPKIKALYCEYFNDGGDSSTIDVFPCLRFDRNDDDWASDFDEAVGGPLVQEYFSCDPAYDAPEPAATVSRHYLCARLFAVFGRLVCKHVPDDIPCGFAEHDHPVVYVMTAGTSR